MDLNAIMAVVGTLLGVVGVLYSKTAIGRYLVAIGEWLKSHSPAPPKEPEPATGPGLPVTMTRQPQVAGLDPGTLMLIIGMLGQLLPLILDLIQKFRAAKGRTPTASEMKELIEQAKAEHVAAALSEADFTA